MDNSERLIARPDLVEVPLHLEEGRKYDVSIGVGDSLPAPALVQFASEFKLRHIVQASSHDYDLELKLAELMLTQPKVFTENPLSSILDPQNAGPTREQELCSFTSQFTTAKCKRTVLELLQQHVHGISKSAGLTHDIVLAADELITNAIYNAPYVNYKVNAPGAPRTEAYGEASHLRPGAIFVGHNERRLILGCVDSYGTLNPSCLIKKLKKCFDDGAMQSMNLGDGGAGLGTFMVFQSALSMYVGVLPNQKTVVCCAFSLEKRARIRETLPKNLHICPENDPAA